MKKRMEKVYETGDHVVQWDKGLGVVARLEVMMVMEGMGH